MNRSCPRCDTALFAEQEREGWERFCVCCGWREKPARIFSKPAGGKIGHRKTQATRDIHYRQAVDLAERGFSRTQIADKVGYSASYVTEILKRSRA
jgi:hypothetical protein